MIIWMPEKMNQQAANKILKVLEEPPEMTFFALVSENLDPILPTILSRTQLIRIPKIADEDLLSAFSNTEGKSREEILAAVRMSEGNFVAARTFLSGNGEEHVFFTLFRDWMRDCYRFDGDAQADPEALAKMFRFADEMGRESREYQKSFLSYALHCIRDAYIYSYIPQKVVREQTETDFIAKFRNTLSPESCQVVAEELEKAIYHVERNAHSGILFQDLGIRLSSAFTRLKR
jgi:DNA polymerase-3 subunit delta'